MTENLCTTALVVLGLAAIGALKTVSSVVSLFSTQPTAIVKIHSGNHLAYRN